jgi:TatA/E family protein of Tat protein translocase
MPFNIGPGELILILVIALVVLGPGKLPDVAQSLGKSVREFRKAATDVTEAGKLDAASTSTSTSTTPPAAAPTTAASASPDSTPVAPHAAADGQPAAASEPARDPNPS